MEGWRGRAGGVTDTAGLDLGIFPPVRGTAKNEGESSFPFRAHQYLADRHLLKILAGQHTFPSRPIHAFETPSTQHPLRRSASCCVRLTAWTTVFEPYSAPTIPGLPSTVYLT